MYHNAPNKHPLTQRKMGIKTVSFGHHFGKWRLFDFGKWCLFDEKGTILGPLGRAPPPDKEAFINYVRGLYHLTGKILVIHFVISPVKRVYNFVILPIENYENFVIPLTCKENWKPAIILLKFITFEVYHLTIICWEVCYTVLAVCFSLYIMEW